MNLNKILIGESNPAIILFGLRGEFEAQGLRSFDYVELYIGNEVYSTIDTPEQLFIEDEDPNTVKPKIGTQLYLKIGTTTLLRPNSYVPTIKGYNLRYPDGYTLTSPKISLIPAIEII